MSEEEKKAILILETIVSNGLSIIITEDIQKKLEIVLNLIQSQQEEIERKNKEIEKKDKIINLMAKEIDDCGECPHEIYEENFDCEHCENYSSIDCWRKYFEKKVEGK